MALASFLPVSVKTLISDNNFLVNPFLFQPQPPSYAAEDVEWLPELNVPAICIWQPRPATPLEKDPFTIVFFHGNACDLGHTRRFAEQLANACKVNVISVEYPGYGVLNQTRPCPSSFLAASTQVVLHLVTKMDVMPARLILYGRSLGGAAALHVAAYLHQYHQMRIGGVITQAAFASVQHMAANAASVFLGSWFGPLCSSLCVVEGLDNVTAVSQLHPKTPVLFMHGDKDNVVPIDQMRVLFDARAAVDAFMVIARGANHNNMSEKFIFTAVRDFLNFIDNKSSKSAAQSGFDI